MKVFISSLIGGFEAYRDAVAGAISTLGHEPVRAEDFPASPDSPQHACLAGVRAAEAVVLILGERYGYPQQSGLSATHEEYREARESRPVLVFIERDVTPEPRQLEFIREVQGWEQGHYTADFADPTELRDRVTRGLHDFTLANEVAPLDEDELLERARALIPANRSVNRTAIVVAIAGGPRRAVLRPAELEDEALRRFLLAETLTGDQAVLTPSSGTDVAVHGDTIQLTQRDAERVVALDESGGIVIGQPAVDQGGWRSGIPSMIEEDVTQIIDRCFRFASRLLDHIDPVGRLTHVAPVVGVIGAGYLPWRTRADQERDPSRATMPIHSSGEAVVALNPAVRRRPALVHDASGLAQDFTVRLRRELGQ